MFKRNAWQVEKMSRSTDFDAENDNGAAYAFLNISGIFSRLIISENICFAVTFGIAYGCARGYGIPDGGATRRKKDRQYCKNIACQLACDHISRGAISRLQKRC